MGEQVKIGIIGCGNISPIYLQSGAKFEILDIVAVADKIWERAESRAAEYGVPRACTVKELLADPEIEIVVNITTPDAHAEVGLQVLEAGKSVYNEKPLAITREDGKRMVELAAAKGVRIGGAPDTFLGGGIQTCRKLIDDGWIGEPVAATAFMMGHGHESWHPDPEFYYKVGGGPMFDMGPYYLTALVNLVGPVKRVTGSARITFPERTITSQPKFGTKIEVEVPTHIAGVLDFANGAVGTIITSFDVWGGQLPRIEIYGTEGTLSVPDPNTFGGPIRIRPRAVARVARGPADLRLCREQPRPGRGRHGARPAVGPQAPRERRADLSRAGHHARHPRCFAREPARRAREHLRKASALSAGHAAGVLDD